MHDTVTHITSFCIVYEGRVIQRCALCGAKIIDARPANCMVPEGCDTAFPTWPVDRLLRVSVDTNPTTYELLPEGLKQLPPDSCIELIEGEE